MHRPAALVLVTVVAGCALKSDVRRVEAQVGDLRAETARADSARAAALEAVRADLADVERRLSDALAAHAGVLTVVRGEVRQELLAIQQQLVQIQELMARASSDFRS